MSTKTAEPSAWSGLIKLAHAFAGSSRNWVVLARNLIPVAGVYMFDWSVAITTFNYWFDGVSALAAVFAFVCGRTAIEMRSRPDVKLPSLIVSAVFMWALLFGMFGIPYWGMLGTFHELPLVLDGIRHSPLLLFSFGLSLTSHVWNAFHGSYMTLPETRLRAKVQSDLYALVSRAMVMLYITNMGFGFMLVPLMALILTGVEVWPNMIEAVARKNQAKHLARDG